MIAQDVHRRRRAAALGGGESTALIGTYTCGDRATDDYRLIMRDTDVRGNIVSDVNYSTLDFHVHNFNGESGAGSETTRIGMFSWDLNEIKALLDGELSGKRNLTDVKFSVYIYENLQPVANYRLNFYIQDQVWIENEATWDDKTTGVAWGIGALPAYYHGVNGPPFYVSDAFTTGQSTPGWRHYDNTNSAGGGYQNWVTEVKKVLGLTGGHTGVEGIFNFMIFDAATSSFYVRFKSRREADLTLRPYLSLTFEAI